MRFLLLSLLLSCCLEPTKVAHAGAPWIATVATLLASEADVDLENAPTEFRVWASETDSVEPSVRDLARALVALEAAWAERIAAALHDADRVQHAEWSGKRVQWILFVEPNGELSRVRISARDLPVELSESLRELVLGLAPGPPVPARSDGTRRRVVLSAYIVLR